MATHNLNSERNGGINDGLTDKIVTRSIIEADRKKTLSLIFSTKKGGRRIFQANFSQNPV